MRTATICLLPPTMANDPRSPHHDAIDWEAFYANYRKPGYIHGYEILNKLGAGAFGIVFKARKQSIGKDYAIKFLKVDDAAIRDAVIHELDTVRLFAQIDAPNLVSIEDMGHVDGIPYIVMGYAGEETLARRLQAGRLSREAALAVFVQVARGVQALHARMLVHFDLKPANVYLKDDIARVGDYGLSKLVTASRLSLSFGRGTAYYMAPEVLHRRGDHRSDIYSLGVLLYECLLGEVPFRGETEWEVLKQHETKTPHYPSSLAPQDRAALEACLAKDPDARAQSVEAILALITGGIATVPVSPPGTPTAPTRPGAAARVPGAPFAPPRTAAESGQPRPRGRRFLAIGVALAVVLGAAATFQARGSEFHFQRQIDAQLELARQAATSVALRQLIPVSVAATSPTPTAPPAPVPPRGPSAQSLLMDALLKTLRHVDTGRLKGQDPLAEAILEMVKASLDNEEVRRSWSDAIDAVLPRATGQSTTGRRPR